MPYRSELELRPRGVAGSLALVKHAGLHDLSLAYRPTTFEEPYRLSMHPRRQFNAVSITISLQNSSNLSFLPGYWWPCGPIVQALSF